VGKTIEGTNLRVAPVEVGAVQVVVGDHPMPALVDGLLDEGRELREGERINCDAEQGKASQGSAPRWVRFEKSFS
jgi:hypothetical protein